MTTQQPDKLKSLGLLVADICGLQPQLEQLIPKFRQAIAEADSVQQPSLNKNSGAYWRLVAFTDSLVRLRLFLEQNFSYVETMGLLAVTRYLFELTVWLKLMQMDSRYGLVYYCELLKNQLDYYTELRNNASREVTFLREIGTQEDKLMESRLADAMRIPDEETRKKTLSQLSNDVMQQIDQAASRSFSLYAEQAQTNGYGFQAHLVETKVLPRIAKDIAGLEHEWKRFERDVLPSIRGLVPKRWNWKDQAALVNMKDEYDFVYSYTSRLLHAKPSTLTTDQKNLEPDEVRIFLKYFRVRLHDVIEMAEEPLAGNSRTMH